MNSTLPDNKTLVDRRKLKKLRQLKADFAQKAAEWTKLEEQYQHQINQLLLQLEQQQQKIQRNQSHAVSPRRDEDPQRGDRVTAYSPRFKNDLGQMLVIAPKLSGRAFEVLLPYAVYSVAKEMCDQGIWEGPVNLRDLFKVCRPKRTAFAHYCAWHLFIPPWQNIVVPGVPNT